MKTETRIRMLALVYLAIVALLQVSFVLARDSEVMKNLCHLIKVYLGSGLKPETCSRERYQKVVLKFSLDAGFQARARAQPQL